jgi:hypothetical protein
LLPCERATVPGDVPRIPLDEWNVARALVQFGSDEIAKGVVGVRRNGAFAECRLWPIAALSSPRVVVQTPRYSPVVSDDRLGIALTRWLAGILEGAPGRELMSHGFVYEQHYGNQAGTYEGEAGMRLWIQAFWEVWDEAQLEVRELRGAAGHRFADCVVTVHAPLSGITVELHAYAVASFDADGRLLRVDTFNDVEEAQAQFAAAVAD